MSELRIDRHFAADPEAVFAFVTRQENLLKWWGPEGMSVETDGLDFTAKGPWGSTMVNPEGGRYKVTGEVIAIDPPQSVELTWAWHDENDARGHESKVRFEVASDGAGGTNFSLIHSGLADEESVTNHNMGWTSSLKKLERMAV